jgi:hypothetical protein
VSNVFHSLPHVQNHLSSLRGDQIAEDIEPLEIQKWFNALHNKEEYGWTTVSKIRGIMNRIVKIGIIHKKATKNPVEGLRTSVKTTYKAIKITHSGGRSAYLALAGLRRPQSAETDDPRAR